MNKYWITVLLFLLPWFLIGIEVDTDELETIINETIEFQNYTGPVIRFETDLQIRSIGGSLAEALPSGPEGALVPGSADFNGRYKITRIPPFAQSALRGADILEFLPGASVDHIDNVRRIISGYLEGAFGYSRTDARTLSIFITVYNAVHRKALARFETRFIPGVIDYLDPEKIGLGLRYTEWPGQSQIIIPLNLTARIGDLSSVASDEIASPEVVESLRDTEDRGITERQEISDLIDRAVESESDQIQEERQEIADQQRTIEQATQELETRIQDEQQALREAEETEDEDAIQEIRDTLEELEEERLVIEQEEQEVQERQEVLDTREQVAREAQERSDEVRREVVEDVARATTEASQERKSAPVVESVLYAQSRLENQILFTEISRINATDGSTLSPVKSPEFVGRQLVSLGNEGIGIQPSANPEQGILFKMNQTSLEETMRAQVPVYIQSHIVHDGENNVFYTVIFSEGDWYIGQFDSGLNIVQSSVIVVRPETSITVTRNVVLVTRKDGRIARLSRSNLRIE